MDRPTRVGVIMENAHPLVVHFPIALFVTAFALETIGLIFRWESARRVAWWNLAAGSLGAVGAGLTGGGGGVAWGGGGWGWWWPGGWRAGRGEWRGLL